MVVEIKLQTKIGPNHDLVRIGTKVKFFAGGGFGQAQKMINVICEQSLINVICEESLIIVNIQTFKD